ncbi:MAG: sodium:solute symporter [Bacteroidetes bacterium GWE2_41_25]|nr:MAG: sodium:solute symporter [Bacteroidetes bacterium GWA2_40_15]OFX88506.1 MAG: sodium:solute symporter [Bacteroidetes bacterium GWC2_40_22]OFY08313.1 MAG: sodium:solute symporter [Bacteroidetes bacterium GWE2_41_25]HAM11088.1 sodium:solute symporter [Bacteroidales bacterium]HBH82614.1 sodium:solute symporter [Bacteroidales bacterium]
MHTIDILIFIAYLSGIVVFGSSFYSRNKTSVAFTLGNKSIPSWVITMSIFATFVSSISYIALPGQAFQSNWNPFVFSLSIPFAAFMTVKVFVPHYRSINSPSAYTYLELRFGRWARIYASAMYLLTQLMRTGTILYLLALTLNIITGWNMVTVILLTGVSVMIYSMLGGIQAVVWTDAIQAIILIAGALVSAFVILFSMPEGPGQLFQIAGENHKFSLGSFKAGLTESTFWVVLIYGLFINLQNFGIDQNYIQRYMTAASDKEAKKSAMWGGLLYIPVSMLFLFIGTALFSFYTANQGMLPDNIQSDRAFPYFIVNNLPVGLTGLLIASIFAAGMSTISTSINSSATIILNDYFVKNLKDENREPGSMKVLYISSFLFSMIAIIVALAMINVHSALETWWKLASVFSGGMLGIFLLGLFSRRVNNTSAIIGVIAGLLVIGWMSLSPFIFPGTILERFANPFHSYLSIVFGTTFIFIVGFLVGIVSRRSR